MNTIRELFFHRKWVIAAACIMCCLLIIQVLFILNKPWVGDYWEHLAVVQELSRNPWSPNHPIIPADLPHSFFSPYSVGLAIFCRMLAIHPEIVLDVAGICNLLLFFYSIWLLSKLVIRHASNAKPFVLLLLFILFFWGILPPYYSSFYHLISLPYVISYPSSFAFSLSIISCHLFNQVFVDNNRVGQKIVFIFFCTVLNYVILISHPLTFLFCCTLYLFIFLKRKVFSQQSIFSVKQDRFFIIAGMGVFIFPICLLSYWPYFSFIDLFRTISETNRFHLDSKVLYEGIVGGYFPLIFAFFFLIFNVVKKSAFAFVIGGIVCLLLIIYVFGLFSGSFGYGRVISFIAIWLQLWITYIICNVGSTIQKRVLVVSVVFLALPFFIFSSKTIFFTAVTTHSHYLRTGADKGYFNINSQAVIAHKLFFIRRHLTNGQLVLCNPVYSRYVPGLGGKTLFNPYADYWIPDNQERLIHVKQFFETTDSLNRKAILEKYKPSFILFSPTEFKLAKDCSEYFINDSIYSENKIVLVKLKFD